MRLYRTALVARAALVALIVWAWACRQSPSEPGAPSGDAAVMLVSPAVAAQTATPAAHPAGDAGPLRRTGLVGMIFHAARDLTLTREQAAALDGMDASLHASDEAVRSAVRSLEAHVIAGIRAGKLDPKTTAPDRGALDAATKGRSDARAAALDALRELLTPAQREDLVLAVRARRAAHSLRPPGAADDDVDDWSQRRLDRLADTLGLDERQKKKVAGLLATSALPGARDLRARKDAEKASGDALLKAFEHDELFDARTLDAGAIVERSGEDLIEGEDIFLGQLIGLLTPAQREKLAAAREGRAPAAE